MKNKTLFITGASRGIGLAIALRAARDGANVVVAAKTTEPHPQLPGTIHTAAEAIEREGGHALPIALDIRDDGAVHAAAKQAADTFGGIDILVNNASAISLTGTLATPMKRFDLMFAVNVRGTYCCSQACVPYLKKAPNPHILTLAPPLNMKPKWFKDHLAYTMAKYGMSMCVLGMAEEFRAEGSPSMRSGRGRSWPPPRCSCFLACGQKWAESPRSWPTAPTSSSTATAGSSAAISASTRKCWRPRESPIWTSMRSFPARRNC